MDGEFLPTHSSNEIWIDDEMDQCLTIKLEDMDTNIASKAASNHTHTGYATTNHTHNNYALTSHTHTGYATESYVDTAVANVVNSAPETLNTLNELADALGDDPNFATTITTQIGSKADANHTHDDRYYTETEVNTKLADKADATHTHSDAVTITKLASIMGGHYTLGTTITKGENYSAVTGSATLVGNMLRVTFSATRSSAASGNINNEILASFSIAHGGKILGGYAVNFNNATSGHICNMNVNNVACDDTALTFNVKLNATAGDTSSINAYFAMPVIIDVTKY